MDLYLNGQTAVVTGASRGLGRAITKELAAERVKVFATGRNEDLLDSLKTEIRETGGTEPVIFVQDFVAADAPEKIAAAALSSFGYIDILVNNAGRSRPLDVIGAEEEWAASMTLDFDRHRQLTQQLLPQFMERRHGAILNITSTYELRSVNASAVAKAGIVVWSKQLSGQLGRYGIRVNSLQPGLIDTENIRRFFTDEQRKAYAEREIPLGDFGEAQDIANMAAFLVSPRAKYITGTVAVVDGGGRHYAF
ncbi:3-oxoacyl-[acyl-carrier protein] reductase [Pedobacter steynii]|uniref:3-oxoacyl-[acyl-carrier protein] reductase n=1 Tax=Pedobacter steynii TaxID=430522 RepID=A0A1G9QW46_9SPHI|nr:SDR family oxidoreductase [Pedobacter steynii]NQX37963.1 SDR family oxidoreductase [Pedobacter steynii]SDM15252.1 3-oxoacyl-[acyl-carrier protein] reductase [Pedobacter steynii]